MFRKRWVRRLANTLIALVILVVGGWFYVRHKSQQQGLERVTAVTARLDADDPRWRLDDIDADRGYLPEEKNGALLIPRFKAALAGAQINDLRPDKSSIFEKVPPNRRLDDEGALAIDRALDGHDAALAVARSFKDYPRGLRRYQISPDVIGTLLPEVQEHRTAAQILKLEAERLCRDDRPGAALQLTPAMLNIARGLDGEPFLISALVRIACDAVAVHRMERTLALGVPRGGLAEVQSALLAEAEGDVFWGPLRGERALMDRLFLNLRAGIVPPSTALTLAGALGGPRPLGGPESLLVDWAYQPFLAQDHAVCLETMTQMYAVRGLPEAQQRAAFRAIPIPPAGVGSQITHVLLPAVDKLHDASLRHKLTMRCAGVAIACERFRHARGRWPDSLAELPKDLLAAIPPDPFDGLPLKYAKRPDGVTVYSVGFDGIDDGGNLTDKNSKEVGTDLGFRLYNPDQRGLPAVPRIESPPDPDAILGPPARLYGDQKPPVEFPPPPREIDGPNR
jgi:hypothetical protein